MRRPKPEKHSPLSPPGPDGGVCVVAVSARSFPRRRCDDGDYTSGGRQGRIKGLDCAKGGHRLAVRKQTFG